MFQAPDRWRLDSPRGSGATKAILGPWGQLTITSRQSVSGLQGNGSHARHARRDRQRQATREAVPAV